ncbi:CusA/CzcA family heavy metal efflux RND transporter [Hymenobacter rubripertinctus]|uniref:CusA/CzcA family heavy metal efflux RND transporter n=1 Tax=Hymenobacter rubripertinctus TaxID=2029981 RepID=A0A418R4B8_9BACT|nr:CusA/CzcA family heavy metal efflux RND transporter [Hymenobacter rubripertinctus]RIY12390.1 CusA/CzcA family heavy metal efflux RND transporter [Hymenobacter rubripertinctus]
MLDSIIRFSIGHKLLIGLLTLALVAWGGYSVLHLPIDAVPDITNNQVQVITQTPSLGAPDVERLVTFPIEQAIATIPDVQEVRSFSRFGLSVVTIVFPDDTDIYWARNQVNERLKEAERQIPPGAGTPGLAPVTTGLGEIYQYVLHPKKGYEKQFSPTELRTVQDWLVRRQLLGTPGVADVSSFGGNIKQYEVAVEPERLRAYNVSIGELFAALEQNNQNTGGAYIDKNPAAYFIRTEGLVGSLEDVGRIVVKAPTAGGGVPVLVRDVAEVRFGHAVRYGLMTRNQEGEVVGALVLMLKGANSSEVIKAVKERMAVIEKTLPEGLVIEPFLDRTKLVDHAISTVTKNLAEGALIVIFVLVLFLGNWRAGLVVASVIPLSMLFAISLMRVFGVSGNLLSLGAIDFGLIVDGAVIIVEAIVHRLATLNRPAGQLLNGAEMDEEVYQASSKIRSSAAFGEIIILIVYLPLLALGGIEGKMFRPMAQTVAFAILGAFILSLTYVPMLSALALSRNTEHKPNISDRVLGNLARRYQRVVDWALGAKTLILGTALALFVGALLLFGTLGGEFIPTLEEGDFAVETRVLPGSSITYTAEKAQQAAGILLKHFPEVKEVVAKVGSSAIPTDPMPVEACDLIIVLKDKEDWTSADSREGLVEKMSARLSAIPGVTFGFQQPIQMRFNELISGAKQDVVIKIFGEDLQQLDYYAGQVGELVKGLPGATDLYVERATGQSQLVAQIDRNKLAQYGLSVEDVNRTVRAAFAGEVAGQVFEKERRFDLVVRLKEDARQDISHLRQLFVAAPDGRQVPLEQVAKVELVSGPSQIQRDDAKRRVIVGFNVRGRDVESLVQQVQQRIDKQMKFAPGYYVTYGGQFENLQSARARLLLAVPVALLLIFVLLYATFNSVSQSVMIFTAIPLSAIGGVLALWLRGMPFSISAGVGFIALFGVAVLNGIVLIGYFNQLKEEGITDLRARILEGTHVRLRPVLMTATVASLGFLPMALSNSAGGEVQKPLATVVIGGLVTATLLTLLVLPVLYYLEETWMARRAAKKAAADGSPAKLGVAGIVLLLTVGGALLPGRALAQAQAGSESGPLNASRAVAAALAQSGTVLGAEQQLAAQQAAVRAARDFGRTTVQGNFGQYNSARKDNSFTISQPLAWPGYYGSLTALAKVQVATQEQQLALVRADVRRQVRLQYEAAVHARHRLRTLRAQDSLYTEFVRAAQLRFRTGETARLEVATALVQQGETRLRLSQTRTEYAGAVRQLQALLQRPAPVAVADSTLAPLLPQTPTAPGDTAALSRSLLARVLAQQVAVARAETRVTQAQGKPGFSVGYFNQSLIGPQLVDGVTRNYGAGDRFQGVQATVAVPLIQGPQKARVQAARLQEKVAQTGYARYQAELAGQVETLLLQLVEQQQRLQFYEQTGLPQAAVITRVATKAFKAGENGYTEYLLNLDRALRLRTDYLDALLQHNQTVIELDYLLSTGQ